MSELEKAIAASLKDVIEDAAIGRELRDAVNHYLLAERQLWVVTRGSHWYVYPEMRVGTRMHKRGDRLFMSVSYTACVEFALRYKEQAHEE